MASGQEFNAVIQLLNDYLDGLYHADSKRLGNVFHRDARSVNTVDGDYMNYSIREYFDIIDHRTPPASAKASRTDEIISIEFGESRMAFAKVSMSMLGRNYLDFLTLVYDQDRWQIMSKVFFYTAK